MKRTNNEEEGVHDVLVASKHLRRGESNLRLNLVLVEASRSHELNKDQRERNERENEEEKANIMAVEKVIGLLS